MTIAAKNLCVLFLQCAFQECVGGVRGGGYK